VEDHQKKKF